MEIDWKVFEQNNVLVRNKNRRQNKGKGKKQNVEMKKGRTSVIRIHDKLKKTVDWEKT